MLTGLGSERKQVVDVLGLNVNINRMIPGLGFERKSK